MANTDFLGQLDADQRETLLSLATPVRVRRREFVFCVGDPGDAVYLLLAGRVKTYKIIEAFSGGPSPPAR